MMDYFEEPEFIIDIEKMALKGITTKKDLTKHFEKLKEMMEDR